MSNDKVRSQNRVQVKRFQFCWGLPLLLLSVFPLSRVEAAEGPSVSAGLEVSQIEADERQVYVHESKKVEVRALIPGASTEEGGSKWNLVQVDETGRFKRYLGILYYSKKRAAFFRKLELQEREPGKRFFEVVSDSELEPFVVRPRTRLEVQVLARPSLIEILENLWSRLRHQST